MNRQTLRVALLPAALLWIAGCGSGTGTTTVGPPAVITATSGTPQSTAINTAFAVPLTAEVTDSHGNPVSGVVVTFTPPSSGASAIFGGGVNTAVTNGNGVATSPVVSANGMIGGPYTVTATVTGVAAPANFSLQNTAGMPASISATSGTPQSTAVNTAFGAPLVAQVLDSAGNPVSGVTVTFTAPSSGASATFAGGVTTATTTASGVATSSVVSANGTVGGPYTVTATVKGVVAPANFTLTNTPTPATKQNFSFYVSGREANSHRGNTYSIAGVFTVNTTNGEVTGGEQDYSDGDGVTSPQPGGDTITGGSLTFDASTGKATLILITNNASVGHGGEERFAVQPVNASHAFITQDDGTATSSGSMDRQTLPTTLSAPTGAFAFLASGVDTAFNETASGGIFRLTSNGDGSSALRGTIDTNDAGSRVTGTSFAATLSPPDSFGRGTVTNNTAIALGFAINYYIVGPEVIRFIDVDLKRGDSGVGSAYGQGTATFTNTSLGGSSVFSVASNSDGSIAYVAAGRLSTSKISSDAADFKGVGDIYENGRIRSGPAGSSISGTYTINSSGYGSLSITNKNEADNQGLADLSLLGIYMVDPHLNINDPNNTMSGTGGAVMVDLGGNGFTVGTGVLVPEADISTPSFAGNYAFRGHGLLSGQEFDFVGKGSIADRALSTAGAMGRYIMAAPTPLAITISDGEPLDFTVIAYPASGGRLFCLAEDDGLRAARLELQATAPSFLGLNVTIPQATK